MKPFNFILGLLACLVLLMSACNAVNIESSSKAQVLAGTSNKLKEENENQWIYDLIEGFLQTLPIPGFVMDIIENILCDIDDGFSFCKDDDDDDMYR